jgi:hypothetical protein
MARPDRHEARRLVMDTWSVTAYVERRVDRAEADRLRQTVEAGLIRAADALTATLGDGVTVRVTS